MKYAIVIPDGASDEPQDSLGGKTPLQVARTPEMDRIAREGILGRSRNVPDRFIPASDVATLSLFGYDPVRYFTGRAPLEAVAMGIELGPDDWAVRCNLMTIDDGLMSDFTAGHITSEEARQLISMLNDGARNLEVRDEDGGWNRPEIEFHAGVSYRNALIVRGRPGQTLFTKDTHTTPPHDVPDQPADNYLPTGTGANYLNAWMKVGSMLITVHPLNVLRKKEGKRQANAVWLWGQGKAPAFPKFADLHGLKGAIISAVDLVRGVGILAGWTRIDVPGTTGYLDTDYAAKGRYGIEALKNHDLVCVHVEAPDEASHEGRDAAKVEALERMDSDIVGPLRHALEQYGDWRILISPDHSTLLRTKAHDRAPVPWAMAGTGLNASGAGGYDEFSAQNANGPFLAEGWRLMEQFLYVS